MKSRKTIGDLILLALEKSVDGYVRLEDFAYNTHIYARGYDRPLKKSSLAKAFERLRIKGYINAEKFENGIILKLTERGRKFSGLQFRLNEEWDGLYRVVIFDIPEEFKKVRRQLRLQLKDWEFTQLQKSVWVSKKNVLKELQAFIKEVNITNWVKVFEAKLIDL